MRFHFVMTLFLLGIWVMNNFSGESEETPQGCRALQGMIKSIYIYICTVHVISKEKPMEG